MDDVEDSCAPESFRSAVAADFRASSWIQRLLLLGVVFWLGYEWSAGNETFTPWLLVNVIAATSGVWTVVATAAVGFAFTTAQQLMSGFVTAAGFARFDRSAQAAWRWLSKRTDTANLEWSAMGWGTRALVVFSLGTTAVVLIQVAVTGTVGVARHRMTVVQSASLCGAIVGLIGAAIASLVWAGRSVEALNTVTDWALRILGNPLVWIGLLVVLVAVQTRSNRSEDDENVTNITVG